MLLSCPTAVNAQALHRTADRLLASETAPAAPDFPTIPSGPSPLPGFYVAPDGSDAADGSWAHPFATLDRARQAMAGAATQTTYLQGGIFTPRSTLTLGAADSGTSFLAAPGETPVLDGSAAGLDTLVALDGATNIVIAGLTLRNTRSGQAALSLAHSSGNVIAHNEFDATGNGLSLVGASGNTVQGNVFRNSAQSAIEASDGADDNVFDSNVIDGTGAISEAGGAFFLHGANRNRITHNLVQHTAGVGIGIENWDDTTINVGNSVTWNIVRDTSVQSTDSGAIYMLGRSHVDTGTVIANNLVDGTGVGGNAHTIGIYLDDSTSGVEVFNNIVRNIGTHAVELHGGDRVTITNNIFDLGASGMSAVLFQAAPADTNPTNTQANDVVQGNIIVASGSNQVAFSYDAGGAPVLRGNLYHGLASKHVAAGSSHDGEARFGDPGFVDAANGDYSLQAASTAAAAGFSAIDQSSMGPRPELAKAVNRWPVLTPSP